MTWEVTLEGGEQSTDTFNATRVVEEVRRQLDGGTVPGTGIIL